MLDKIALSVPSFGAPRHTLNEAIFQNDIELVEVQKEFIQKQFDFHIISQSECDNKLGELEIYHAKVRTDNIDRVAQAKQIAHKDAQIIYAFTCKDTDYFQFADFNNMPPLRSLKTMCYFEEMKMKVSAEFIELHTKANDNILSSVKIDSAELSKLNEQVKETLSISLSHDFFNVVIKALAEIKKLNDQLKQRLYIAVDLEQLYKIASIIYFDKDEDVSDYDFGYNAKKITYWKKEQGVDFFLLNQPLQELLPILKDLSGNLEEYSRIVNQMNGIHLENLLRNLPTIERSKLNGKYSSSAAGMQQS